MGGIGIPLPRYEIRPGNVAYAICKVCEARIRLYERKDEESWTGIEYAKHYAVHHEGQPSEVSAYDQLGRRLLAGIEVLHMADRAAAIEVVRLLFPLPTLLDEVLDGMDAVGAGALARDVREVVRQQKRPRKRKAKA